MDRKELDREFREWRDRMNAIHDRMKEQEDLRNRLDKMRNEIPYGYRPVYYDEENDFLITIGDPRQCSESSVYKCIRHGKSIGYVNRETHEEIWRGCPFLRLINLSAGGSTWRSLGRKTGHELMRVFMEVYHEFMWDIITEKIHVPGEEEICYGHEA